MRKYIRTIIALFGFLIIATVIPGGCTSNEQHDNDFEAELRAAIDKLNHEDPDQREKAAYFLVQRGYSVLDEMLPLLVDMAQNDESDAVRLAALGVFSHQLACGIDFPEFLVELTEHKDPAFRAEAIRAIRIFINSDTSLCSIFLKALTDSDPQVRKEAVISLRNRNCDDEDVDSTLKDMLQDESLDVRFEAAYHFMAKYEDLEATVPVFIEALDDPLKKADAVKRLGSIGPVASDAVPHLIEIATATPPKPDDMDFLMQNKEGLGATTLLGRERPGSVLLAHLEEYSPDSINFQSFEEKTYNYITLVWDNGRETRIEYRDFSIEHIRQSAVLALGQISSQPEVINLLFDFLEDEDLEVRKNAILALTRNNIDEVEGLYEVILKILEEGEDDLRIAAVRGIYDHLVTFGPSEIMETGPLSYQRSYIPDVETYIPLLVIALDDNSYVKSYAADCLGNIGYPASAAIPKLIDILRQYVPAGWDENSRLYSSAAYAIMNILTDQEEALPLIQEFVKHQDPGVRAASCLGILLFGEDKSEILSFLIAALDDSNEAVVRDAIFYLSYLGPDAEEAVPFLIKHLHSEDASIREWTAITISEIGPAAEAAIPDLIALLDDESWPVKEDAARALGAMGISAIDAMPKLRELTSTHSFAQPERGSSFAEQRAFLEFAYALAKIDTESGDGLDMILAAMEHDELIRLSAIETLGRIADVEDSVIPMLIEMLSNDDADIRCSSAWGLNEAGSSAIDALPDLRKIAESDPDENTRIAAMVAIENIEGSNNP